MSFHFKFVDETEVIDATQSNENPEILDICEEEVSNENLSSDLIKRSTPANSQGQELFHPSQTLSDIQSPEAKKLKLEKLSKRDALDLLKQFDTQMSTASHILQQLSGSVFKDISSTDLEELENAKITLRKRLGHLLNQFQARKFRNDPSTLDVTFVNVNTFPVVAKLAQHTESQSCESLESAEDNTFGISSGNETKRDLLNEGIHESDNLDLSMLVRVEEATKVEQTEEKVDKTKAKVDKTKAKDDKPKERKKRKALDQLQDVKTRKKRTAEDFQNFKDVAAKQGITVTQLAGHFIQRINYNTNKQLAALGAKLFEGEEHIGKLQSIGNLEALHIASRYRLGKGRFIQFRRLLKNSLTMPSYASIALYRRSITPEIIPYHNENGVIVGVVIKDLGATLALHLLRGLQYWDLDLTNASSNVLFSVTGGLDGRGDEKEYAQRSQVDLDTTHAQSILFYGTSLSLLPPQLEIPKVEIPEAGDTSCIATKESDLTKNDSLRSSFDMFEDSCEDIQFEDTKDKSQDFHGYPSQEMETDMGPLKKLIETEENALDKSWDKFIDKMIDEVITTAERYEEVRREPKPVNLKQIQQPLDFQRGTTVIYKAKQVNSHLAACPIGLMFERELHPNVKRLMKTFLEPQLLKVKHFRLSPEPGDILFYLRCEDPLQFLMSIIFPKSPIKETDDAGPATKSSCIVPFPSSKYSNFAGWIIDWRRQQKWDKIMVNKEVRSVKDLQKPVLIVSLPDLTNIAISIDFQLTAMDNKMITELNQRAGAFCFSCTHSEADLHDVSQVVKRIYMNFSTEDLWTKFQSMAMDHEIPQEEWDDWEIVGTSKERMGMMRMPLLDGIELNKIFAVLHNSSLRCLSNIEQLIIRDASNCKQWGKGHLPIDAKLRMEKTKTEFRNLLGPLFGYKNKPCPNQVTGALCNLFFGQERREDLLDAIDTVWSIGHNRRMTAVERENYRHLLQSINILRKIASSDMCIKVFDLWEFCIALHIFIIDKWPFFLWGKAFHRFVDHLVEHIILNNNHGLKTKSETPIESSHHIQRDDREDLARKNTLENNATDVFNRKWVAADPGVRSLDTQPHCQSCGSTEHWTVSCPLKTAGPLDDNDDEEILNKFVVHSGEDEPEDQIGLLDTLEAMWQQN